MRLAKFLILSAVFLSAVTTVGYELLSGSILTQLLGSSVLAFSLTIGVYLAALGVGGWLSGKLADKKIAPGLILIESSVAIIGGSLAVFFYWVYGFVFNALRNSAFTNLRGFVFGAAFGELAFIIFSLSFLFLVGLLDGFALPLYSRLLAEKEQLSRALGKAFFWDYAGALVTAISFPIIFYPWLGILKTSFLAGLANALAALMILLLVYQQKFALTKRITFWIKAGVAIALLFNLIGFSRVSKIEPVLQKNIYGRKEILFHQQSPYQEITFTKDENGAIRLYLSGSLQFESGLWDASYHESLVHPAFAINPKAKNVLVLGGGDGLALREILKYPQVKSVILVDIDEKMVEAASQLDFMKAINQRSFEDKRVKALFQDGLKFVEKTREKYDIVIVDFPDATDDGLARLYSREFYRWLGDILTEKGLAVIQSAGFLMPPQRVILKTLEAANLPALPYHNPNKDLLTGLYNFGFTLASRLPISKDDFLEQKITVPTRVLRSENLANIFTNYDRGVPLAAYQPKVNSFFHPVITASQGDVFIGRYIESSFSDGFPSQIQNLIPLSEIQNQIQDFFFK
ncbi:MAG: hypothetical protein A3A98_03165 [Candidatus Staskawiczbacteria bacterium RIFCSPLOWO2_01_FULL_40_39]|nr:MAG: hypothetical protein A3A98_03165 [Candidatus Staskawiczbacteria bacterium RIFCSPLOWO2_01_FULL_40_39]